MKCPEDQKELETINQIIGNHWLLVHKCLHCQGKLLNIKELELIGLKELDALDPNNSFQPGIGILRCPYDNDVLGDYGRIEAPRELELHSCNSCDRIWLRKGELKKLIEFRLNLVNKTLAPLPIPLARIRDWTKGLIAIAFTLAGVNSYLYVVKNSFVSADDLSLAIDNTFLVFWWVAFALIVLIPISVFLSSVNRHRRIKKQVRFTAVSVLTVAAALATIINFYLVLPNN